MREGGSHVSNSARRNGGVRDGGMGHLVAVNLGTCGIGQITCAGWACDNQILLEKGELIVFEFF